MGMGSLNPPVYMTGVISFHAAVAGQPGWLRVDGKSIGSAASGATARANADTYNLFAYLWANFTNAQIAIQDNAGVASVRGASAIADFNAGKRLPLNDPGADFPRILSATVQPGRKEWSREGQQLADHYHALQDNRIDQGNTGSTTAAGDGATAQIGNPLTFGPTLATGGTVGAENRPQNTAWPVFIHL
jgi:hypothetical protein